jgi:parallel beta-helix repeat protein
LGGTIELFNTLINNNRLLYNIALNCNGFLEVGSESNGQAINNLIAYNKIINCGQTAIFHNKVNGSFVYTNNTMFYNNVIIENKIQFTKASAMFWYADPTINDIIILKNNIIWLTTGENVVNNNLDTTKMVHTNNMYKLRNSFLGVNLDPTEVLLGNVSIFVDSTGDPENWDYRIIEGSFAINLGIDVGFTQDFAGNPIKDQPDAGIYEYVSPVILRQPKKFYANPSSTSLTEDGSINNPWKSIETLNVATILMVPGDTVFLKSGEVFNGILQIKGSGNISKPIVYTSYSDGPKPILTTSGSDIITIKDNRYIKINGLALTDRTMNTNDHSIPSNIDYGIVLSNAPNCTISNCTISLVGIGIATQNGSNFTTISGNTISNLRAIKNTIGGGDDYGAIGLLIGSSSNQIVQNNIDNCWATSYDYGFTGGGIELFNTSVNNNYFLYNSVIDCAGFLEVGGESSGTAINNLFAYNKIINSGQTAIFHNKIDGNYINTNNTRIFNNDIIETKIQFNQAKDMFSYDDPSFSEIVILKNNIIWLTNGQNVVSNNIDTSKMVHTNNIYMIRNGILGINLDKSENVYFNNIQLFTDTIGDPKDWDYHLPSNTLGINYGIFLGFNRDYIGNPIIGKPDAGIYEYQFTDTIAKLKAIATIDSIQCNGGNGIIKISAIGGIPPYLGTGSYIRAVGIYQFIVTDAIGSKDTVLLNLVQPNAININIGYSIITTYNTTTTINVTATGGVPPYTYQLDNGVFQSSNLFTNQTAGVYKVTVKDAKGCTTSKTVNLTVTSITLNLDKRLAITVSPNPSYSSFTVSTIKYRGGFVSMNLNIYNAFGQLVYSAQGLSNMTYTFGANFVPGNYILVAVVDGTVQAVKLIKL